MPSFRSRILTFFCRIPAFLPLGVLYVLSDVMAFMAHRVFRYRVATVRDNLRQCFPDKTEKELRTIERRFYRNFTDYVVETVKLLHISDKTVMRRMTFTGVDIMDNYVAQGRDIVVYFSHTGNWEWAPAVRLYSRFAEEDAG